MYLEQRQCKNELCKKQFETFDLRKAYHSRKCQQHWNNYKAKLLRDKLNPISSILKKNRKVLKRIFKAVGGDLVTSDYLKGAQFNFSVFTHSNLESEKLTYYVFDYGLQKMGPNKFKVIKYEK